MPYKVVKGKGTRPWKIVRLRDNKVVGTSTSKAKAEASVRVRMSRHK